MRRARGATNLNIVGNPSNASGSPPRVIPAFAGVTSGRSLACPSRQFILLGTFRTILLLLGAITVLLGCESADKYRKVPSADSTAAPTVGTLAISGTPAQMAVVKSLAHEMETAESQWDTGNHDAAIATVDSLRMVSEAVLDTIPLDQPIAKFLLVYVTNTYERLIVWGQERSDDNAVKALTGRFESLAARLQVRRDSTAAARAR